MKVLLSTSWLSKNDENSMIAGTYAIMENGPLGWTMAHKQAMASNLT